MIKENKNMNILNVEKCNHSGTSFIGNYKTSYDDLVDAFGEPNYARWYDENKTDSKSYVTWILQFETDLPFNELITVTIYDWKEEQNSDGLTRVLHDDGYDWHIGGCPKEDGGLALDVLAQYLESGEVEKKWNKNHEAYKKFMGIKNDK